VSTAPGAGLQRVCVFCSSSEEVAPVYLQVAQELGQALAERNLTLVYGGCHVGTMGVVARSVHRFGGTVVGVIPAALRDRGLAYVSADELIVTSGLRERKAEMEARADAFVVLPGGVGTLEEALEILAQKTVGAHQKPMVFVNTRGFYDALVGMFESWIEQRFARPAHRELYRVAPDVAHAVGYLDGLRPAGGRK